MRNKAFQSALNCADFDSDDAPGLWAQFREDWIAHDRDWTRPGFRAICVYRFGVWRQKVRHRAIRGALSISYDFLFRWVKNHYGIELSASAVVGRRVVLEHQHGIVVHGHCEIGDDCVIRQGVTLGYLERRFDCPRLGKRVNVGAGAKILGRVQIGDGASIGANTVVLIDVPAGATVVGNPGRIVWNEHHVAEAASDPAARMLVKAS